MYLILGFIVGVLLTLILLKNKKTYDLEKEKWYQQQLEIEKRNLARIQCQEETIFHNAEILKQQERELHELR